MSEQSDTPRTDATQYQWTRTLDLARDLERELATATRERDEWQRIAGANGLTGLAVARDFERELAVVKRERDEARADLGIERMRLVACGVIALANTPESAARARDILPQYRSASSADVTRAVDREMQLRAEVKKLRAALQRLACLGNGDRPGNSEGNVIALEALAATELKP